MIYMAISILLALVGVIFLIVMAVKKDEGSKSAPGQVSLYTLVGAFVIFMLNWWTIIDPGEGGVVILLGEVDPIALERGFHTVNPFCDIVEKPVRLQEYTMTATVGEGDKSDQDDHISALAADGIKLEMDVTVLYRAALHALPWIYENIGPNYESIIVRATSRTSLREGVKEFTGQNVYATERELCAARVSELQIMKVDSILSTFPDAPANAFVFPPVLLRNIGLPEKVQDAIDEKIAMEQEAARMDFVLDKERKEAIRKEIEANGIKKFQDIVSQGITPSLLKWKGIEATRDIATSENTKVVIIGNDDSEMPIILGGDSK